MLVGQSRFRRDAVAFVVKAQQHRSRFFSIRRCERPLCGCFSRQAFEVAAGSWNFRSRVHDGACFVDVDPNDDTHSAGDGLQRAARRVGNDFV